VTRSTRTRITAPVALPVPQGALPDEAALAAAEEAFIASLNDEDDILDTTLEAPSPVLTPDVVQAMIAEAVARALAQAAPAAPVVEAAPTAEEAPSSEYPVTYYNPRIPDERFYVIGSPYKQHFVRGCFVAQTAQQEASVRACLDAHGRGFADRWKGDDRREWVDRRTGFTTSNENARYDFELYHED
jgi:hypothetical protein